MKKIIVCILVVVITFPFMSNAYANSQSSQKTNTIYSQEKSLSSTLIKNKVSEVDKTYILDAYNIGIVDYRLASKVSDKISIINLVKLFENAYHLRYGKDSQYLADFRKNISSIESCDHDGKATRYNVAELLYYSASEAELDIKYRSFQGFISDVQKFYGEDPYSYLRVPDSAIMIKNEDGTVNANANLWQNCADLKTIDEVGSVHAVNYVVRTFDRSTGERVMCLYDDATYRPKSKINVKTAILAAYHYYRYLMPKPKNVVLEKVGTYNKRIITDTLLKQKTNLPDATNTKLPGWKGFNVDHLSGITHGALSNMPEYWTYEADIKTIAETGANFANIRIGWGNLSAPDFVSDDTVNIYYLESLDRILSWGIKYGVHIQFCFTEGPAMDKTYNMDKAKEKTLSVFTDTKYRNLCVRYWRMLSKRYAKISNRYLSVCLMNEGVPLSDENYAESMKPIIDAIWDESPDRVILADIHSYNCTGESMAALGVALCYHQYRPSELFVISQNAPQIDYKDYYKNLFTSKYSMTGILYSEDGATWQWDNKGDTSKLGGKPDIIQGNLSGTMEIMLKDSSMGKAGLLVKADAEIIYDDVPKTVCDGDPEVDVCYSAEPEIISIPDGTKRLEISCSNGILTLGSVKIKRKDGILIDIPMEADNYQGTDMSTITVHDDGSIESDHFNTQTYLNLKSPLISIMQCKAIAEKYGVGFMCGEWGFFNAGGGVIWESRIPYDDLKAILAACIQSFDENGIPWCGEYRSEYSLTNSYPLNSGTTYKNIAGSSLYLDNVMNKFFINMINTKR